MTIPAFLARKLYKRSSLRETADGRFAFTLHNPLGNATLVAPPRFVINGVRHMPGEYSVEGLDPAQIGPENPFEFPKGAQIDVAFTGRLLRGANRIHLIAETKEFGIIDMLVEDREADYCDLPGVEGASEEE